MPLRCIKIHHVDRENTVLSSEFRQNDAHAASKIDHTLVQAGRYLVSPITPNKSPKYRSRSCIFLKPRRVKGGKIRAEVRFEDDGSEGLVDPGDLLPYVEVLPICYGAKDGVLQESHPAGPVSEILQKLRKSAFDIEADLFRDKFRFLVGTWFCLHCEKNGVPASDFIDDLNARLSQMLGSGHHVQSCVQFMHGKKGQQAFDELTSHAP